MKLTLQQAVTDVPDTGIHTHIAICQHNINNNIYFIMGKTKTMLGNLEL